MPPIHLKPIDHSNAFTPWVMPSDTQVTYSPIHSTESLTPHPNRYWELLRARQSKALEYWVVKVRAQTLTNPNTPPGCRRHGGGR